MTLLTLLFPLMLPAQATDTLFAVDLYGLRSLSETSVRTAVNARSGDPVPESIELMRARLLALPGVAEVDISLVCCSDNRRPVLYVGIRERATPPISFRPAPTGSILLPSEIIAAGDRSESALMNAVQRGIVGEDQSQGYSLAEDSTLRSAQREYIQIAARQLATLTNVLHNSRNTAHRALAAQIIAYAPDRRVAARELLYAAGDPSDDVRNNAVRALAVLAEWVNHNPGSGVTIPAEPFIDLLNSVSWTDRNKGVMLLMPLTASRDSSLMAQVRARGLIALIEMARWANRGHALGPFLILARIAGVDDAEAFRAWQAGEREAIIARAKGSP